MTEPAIRAIAIGASAGAVQALMRILPALPANYPIAVVVVVHIPPGRSNALVSLFQKKCKIEVKEADDKEPMSPGVVYFAPADYHLLVEADDTLSLSSDEPVNHSRPSIDVLMESAADALEASMVGVILTGANDDGAAGLRAVIDAGGVGVVEDPQTAYARTMPAAALAACPSAKSMSIDAITAYLLGLGLL